MTITLSLFLSSFIFLLTVVPMLFTLNVFVLSRIWSGCGHFGGGVTGTLGFHRVSFFSVTFKMSLGFVQVILVDCCVLTTGVVDPWFLCASPIGEQHCQLSSGQDGGCLGVSVIFRLGVIQNSLYWIFHEYLYVVCFR